MVKNWFKLGFGLAAGLGIVTLALVVIGFTGYAVYLRSEENRKDEKLGIAIATVGEIIYDREVDDVKNLAVEAFGVERANRIHQSILYLDDLFKRDSYGDVIHNIVFEVGRWDDSHANKSDPVQTAYLLTVRVQSSNVEGMRFLDFFARNIDVVEEAAGVPLKMAPPKASPQEFPSHEGEFDNQPITPNDTYRYSTIDPATGAPVSGKRSATPGYTYAPQDPGADPGYNSRKITPGY